MPPLGRHGNEEVDIEDEYRYIGCTIIQQYFDISLKYTTILLILIVVLAT